jgi:hypothetical protein
MIHLTANEIATATILYGIVHGIWMIIRHLETQTGRIIKAHVKNGHRSRFEQCGEESCALTTLETELS